MIESGGLDVLETSRADVRRRRWPWVVAGVVALLTLATVLVVPLVQDRIEKRDVRAVARAWATHEAFNSARSETITNIVVDVPPGDQRAALAAAAAVYREQAAGLRSLRDQVTRRSLHTGLAKSLRGEMRSVLAAEAADLDEVASRPRPDNNDVLTGPVTDQIARLGDRLATARNRVRLSSMQPPRVTLHAADAYLARVKRFFDEPVDFQLLVNNQGAPELLRLDNNTRLDVPDVLADGGDAQTIDGVTFVSGGSVVALRTGSPPVRLPGTRVLRGPRPETLWLIRHRTEFTFEVALADLQGRVLSRWSPVPAGQQPVAGTRDGLVIAGETNADEAESMPKYLSFDPASGRRRPLYNDGTLLLGATRETLIWLRPSGHQIVLKDVATGHERVVNAASDALAAVSYQVAYGEATAVSPDDRWIAIGVSRPDGLGLALLDLQRARIEKVPSGRAGEGVSWAPDSTFLITAFYDDSGWPLMTYRLGAAAAAGVRYRGGEASTGFGVLPLP